MALRTTTPRYCLRQWSAFSRFVTASRSKRHVSVAHRPSIKEARPFSDFLTDTHHRQHDYLRISVTEKCNLRCRYCMPEEGVPQSPRAHLLTTSEICLLSALFVSQGVTKIRLTGGEPTVRKDVLALMRQIGSLRRHGLQELCITTNGVSVFRKLDEMLESGLTGLNLSLDTLDPLQFDLMTRRSGFPLVMKTIMRALEMKKLGATLTLKINCVVMRGVNDSQILPFVEFSKNHDVEIRFIEYMPFGGNRWSQTRMLGYQEMLSMIKEAYPTISKLQDHASETSKTYQVAGFRGKIGFITSMTHNFCGSCNRLRITSDGNLKVCLFDNAEVSLRNLLREANHGLAINHDVFRNISHGSLNDLLAENGTDTQKLLDVVGQAVKGKKAEHAGMQELQSSPNRPMILIGG